MHNLSNGKCVFSSYMFMQHAVSLKISTVCPMSVHHLTDWKGIIRCALLDFNIKISSASIVVSMYTNKTNRF